MSKKLVSKLYFCALALLVPNQAKCESNIALNWAKSFIQNQLNLNELESELRANKNSGRSLDSMEAKKILEPIAFKAALALILSQLTDQALNPSPEITSFLGQFQDEFRQNPDFNDKWHRLDRPVYPPNLLQFFEIKAQTPIAKNEYLPNPPCTNIGEQLLNDLISQKKQADQELNYSQVAKIASSYDQKTLSCTVVNAMKLQNANAIDGGNPGMLLTFAAKSNLKPIDSLIVKTLYATHFIQIQNPPEALRILFELQAIDHFFKPIYNDMQRQFSYSQNGLGKVMIKGL